MLYSTGAVNKQRVSWVLRREVCSWFCLATCTQDRNEGRWTSFQGDTTGCNPAAQAHRPAGTDRQGDLCRGYAALKTAPLGPSSLPSTSRPASSHDTTPSPTSPSTSQSYRNRWQAISDFLFFTLKNILYLR